MNNKEKNRFKIAIVDTLFPIGHKELNYRIIESLKKNYDLIVLDYKNYYRDLHTSKKVEFLDIRRLHFPKRVTLFKRFCGCINYLKIIFKLRNVKFDAVFFTSYENFSFGLLYKLFKKNNIFILHHNNIDMIKTNNDIIRFNKYKDNVSHVVLSEYIKDGLAEKYEINPSNIHVVRYPLFSEYTLNKEEMRRKSDNKMFVSLGLGSDEEFISDIINFDKNTGYFKDANFKLIIRSSIYNYERGNLRVFKGFLSSEEYYNYYINCSAYILLYPISFENRFSASLLNALQYGKNIISTDIKTARYHKDLFPNSISIIDSMQNLIETIESYNQHFNEDEYIQIIKYYDDKHFEEGLRNTFDNQSIKRKLNK